MQTKPPTTLDDMKHPAHEQWMDYLYGELPKPQRAELAAHIKSCPSCAGQVARWGAVQGQLDEYTLPDTRRPARGHFSPQWAIAAALMLAALGVGVGVGRSTSTKALRQEMQAALQQAHNDNRLLVNAVQQLDAARQAQIHDLRKDLETVAINADNSFKETEQTLIPLIQLAASQQAGQQ